MKSFQSVATAQEWCADVRSRELSLGLIPTMGALHEGHLELVARSIRENDRTCVSVFVNPLQFNEKSDLSNYPRDFEGDARRLEAIGCSMVFTGTPAEFFGDDFESARDKGLVLDPGPTALGLEGTKRPGHFAGVATVVDRLFKIASPTRAYFGRKDYQQCLVVSALAQTSGEPQVVLCPTVREPSGLAMSSRNLRLNAAQLQEAEVLSKALRNAQKAWDEGERDAARLAAALDACLSKQDGILVEYAAIRDPESWSPEPLTGPLERAVALLAVRVGPVRLIDNCRLDDPSDRISGSANGEASPSTAELAS